MRTKRSTLGLFISIVLVTIAMLGNARAQECYAQLYSGNSDYLETTVDTHGVGSNAYLKDVQIEVTFRFSGKQQTSKWNFTDRDFTSLNGEEVYRRFFRIPPQVGSPRSIAEGKFTFLKQVKGSTAHKLTENDKETKPLNTGEPPTGTDIGEKPPNKADFWK